ITAVAALLAAWSMAGVVPMFGFIGKEALFDAVWELVDAARTSQEEALHRSVVAALTAATVIANIWLVAAAGLIGVKPFFGPMPATPRTPHEAPPSLWLGPLILATLGLLTGLFPRQIAEPI